MFLQVITYQIFAIYLYRILFLVQQPVALLVVQSLAACQRCLNSINKSSNFSFTIRSLSRVGIVQGIGKVQRVDRKTEFCSYSIDFPSGKLAEVQTGGSIAINGTCLTVVGSQGDTAQFDVIGESLKRTNLGLLQEGSKVNFERAARIGDEIGGHNVSGHVHTTATITSVTETENNRRLEFQASSFSNQVHA